MLRTTRHHLMCATVCLLMLAICEGAQSSAAASVGCAELLREVKPSEPASFAPSKVSPRAGPPESKIPMGPLTVSTVNPRYFSDPSGRAVYLTGAHTWNNLVDMDSQYPPRPF